MDYSFTLNAVEESEIKKNEKIFTLNTKSLETFFSSVDFCVFVFLPYIFLWQKRNTQNSNGSNDFELSVTEGQLWQKKKEIEKW